MAMKKGGLGRGMDSLMNDNSIDANGSVTVNLNEIEPNRNQPRKDFDEGALSDLAESIAQHGLIQPIVVRPTVDGRYMIIAGERRWRACRIAGLTEVPVIIKATDDKTLMELALIENLQREDLNPVEEALGFKALIDEFSMTQEEVAKKMGKSRSAVTNSLRLLNLTDEELEAEYEKFAERYQMEKDKIKELVPVEGLRKDLLNEKAIKFVRDNAKVTTARKPRAKKEDADKTDAE